MPRHRLRAPLGQREPPAREARAPCALDRRAAIARQHPVGGADHRQQRVDDVGVDEAPGDVVERRGLGVRHRPVGVEVIDRRQPSGAGQAPGVEHEQGADGAARHGADDAHGLVEARRRPLGVLVQAGQHAGRPRRGLDAAAGRRHQHDRAARARARQLKQRRVRLLPGGGGRLGGAEEAVGARRQAHHREVREDDEQHRHAETVEEERHGAEHVAHHDQQGEDETERGHPGDVGRRELDEKETDVDERRDAGLQQRVHVAVVQLPVPEIAGRAERRQALEAADEAMHGAAAEMATVGAATPPDVSPEPPLDVGGEHVEERDAADRADRHAADAAEATLAPRLRPGAADEDQRSQGRSDSQRQPDARRVGHQARAEPDGALEDDQAGGHADRRGRHQRLQGHEAEGHDDPQRHEAGIAPAPGRRGEVEQPAQHRAQRRRSPHRQRRESDEDQPGEQRHAQQVEIGPVGHRRGGNCTPRDGPASMYVFGHRVDVLTGAAAAGRSPVC